MSHNQDKMSDLEDKISDLENERDEIQFELDECLDKKNTLQSHNDYLEDEKYELENDLKNIKANIDEELNDISDKSSRIKDEADEIYQNTRFGYRYGRGGRFDRGTRPSPRRSATLYRAGERMYGQDGNLWEVVENVNGVKRWKRVKYMESGGMAGIIDKMSQEERVEMSNITDKYARLESELEEIQTRLRAIEREKEKMFQLLENIRNEENDFVRRVSKKYDKPKDFDISVKEGEGDRVIRYYFEDQPFEYGRGGKNYGRGGLLDLLNREYDLKDLFK